jgi:asparagine synthase (glutamine-hydrolysing)
MCGIVGKLYRDEQKHVDPNLIDRMLGTMAHRGPDGEGKYLAGPLGLGHRRLSIIDLSASGSQPMCNEDGTVWIVFNGEIYNYLELRDRLAKRGHTFSSTTDTEVIIHLYEEHGTDCLRHLRGMFAFALWDTKSQRLFLARDRVGIKPLYYCETADALLFASELKSILVDSTVPRDVHTPAIRQFVSFYYPPGEETLLRSVKKLLPGHYLTVERGKVRITQYWDLRFSAERSATSFEDVVAELRSLLASTVRDHMIADVPVGVLLSGGMDSSAVLSFAVEAAKSRIKTFTVGFDGGQVVDERHYARLVAQQFGTEHYDLTISAADFWNFLPSYVWHMEEPVCEPPAVALYYVSKLAREHVKVLLSGEGGDEAFAGYPNYPNMLRLEQIHAVLGPLARPFGAMGALAAQLLGKRRLHRYSAALGRPFPAHYFSRTSGPTFFFNRHAQNFFTTEFLASTSLVNSQGYVAGLAENVKAESLLNQMLYVDTKTWLPGDLLIKADKITMANSVELRVPLLDHIVLEFAASLPPHYKIGEKQTKRILKAAVSTLLPSEILTRKKAGFPVPYGAWLRNGLSDAVRDILLSGRARSRGYFQKGQVERLLQFDKSEGKYSKEVFSLLVIELWHREFVDRVPNGSQPLAH